MAAASTQEIRPGAARQTVGASSGHIIAQSRSPHASWTCTGHPRKPKR